MIKKILFLITILIVIVYSYFNLNINKNDNSLVVGMMSGWAPFMSLNEKGEMIGFDVDLIKELEKELHIKIKIEDYGSVSSLFVALQKNSVDAILSGFDITQERAKKYTMISYSERYKVSDAWCISKKEYLDEIKEKLENNEKLKIGVESGSSMEPALTAYPNIQKVPFGSFTDMIMQLSEGYIDAFIIDKIHTEEILKEKRNLSSWPIPLPDENKIDGIGIVLQKENKEISQKIKEGIEKLQEKGILTELEKKWNIR
jgi:polar amino acid transport system substrate-binding protein